MPLTIPIGSGSPKDSDTPFAGIIDLIDSQALFYDPADQGKTFHAEPLTEEQQLLAAEWREKLFDALTRFDEKDRLTSAYLDGKEIPVGTIRELIRELTLAGHIQPVFAGSGREHIGIQPLIDGVTYYLPSPLDRPPVAGVNPHKNDKEEKRKPDPSEPFCGLVFKIVADTHGELYYVRIYSGTVKANSKALNAGRNTKEMVTKLYHTQADPTDRKELPEAYAGDIVAIIGPKESITGDTLCDAHHPLLLERIQFAQAVVSRSIEPESSADKDKLTSTLNLLKKEDPTFTWSIDKDTGQTLMNGMGMLHLEIKQHRMERDFRLKVRVGQPRVSYRETLRNPITVQGECVKQAGAGSGLFAKLTVELKSSRDDEAVVVTSRLKPEELPPELVLAAEQGVRGALESGELGYPVMSIKATITGAVQDVQLSNDVAFLAAGADARAQGHARQHGVARAVDEADGHRARDVPWIDHLGYWRSQGRSEPGGDGQSRRRNGDGLCAAAEPVRLCRRGAQPEPGPSQLRDGAARISAGARRGNAPAAASGGLLLRALPCGL